MDPHELFDFQLIPLFTIDMQPTSFNLILFLVLFNMELNCITTFVTYFSKFQKHYLSTHFKNSLHCHTFYCPCLVMIFNSFANTRT